MKGSKYELGDLKILVSSEDDEENWDYYMTWDDEQVGHAALPHQCDQWVVGKRADVEKLQHDIEVLLANSEFK